MEEQKNYGFIAGVRTQEIYDYLSEKGNRGSLEAILKQDREERIKLPFWNNAGARVKKGDVEEILKAAKTRVDSFFSLNPAQYNPSIYTRSFMFQYFGVIGLSGFIADVGDMYANPVPGMPLTDFPPIIQTLGGITLVAGIAGVCITTGMALFGSSFSTDASYNHERNKIIAVRSRSNLFKHVLLREYTRAASIDRIRIASIDRIRMQPMAYFPFESGFMEGVAGRLMSKEDAGEHAIALNTSTKHLKKGIECLHMDRKEFAGIAQKLDNEKLPKEHKKGLIGMGYCFFRLAEERHGEDIYREVYNGNTKILFD